MTAGAKSSAPGPPLPWTLDPRLPGLSDQTLGPPHLGPPAQVPGSISLGPSFLGVLVPGPLLTRAPVLGLCASLPQDSRSTAPGPPLHSPWTLGPHDRPPVPGSLDPWPLVLPCPCPWIHGPLDLPSPGPWIHRPWTSLPHVPGSMAPGPPLVLPWTSPPQVPGSMARGPPLRSLDANLVFAPIRSK